MEQPPIALYQYGLKERKPKQKLDLVGFRDLILQGKSTYDIIMEKPNEYFKYGNKD